MLVIDKNLLKVKIEKLTKNYKFKHLNVLCLNKNSIQQFIDYLNE